MGKVPHAICRQVPVELLDVGLVPGFDSAEDVDGGDVGAGEEPVVGDFLHAAAGLGDERREPGQAAGAVADDGREADQTAVDHQGAFNQAAEDGEVDVAAGEDEGDFFSREVRELAPRDGGERGGPGPFDHAFFQLHQADDGQGDLPFADLDDPVHQGAGDAKRIFPDDADR